MAGADASQRLEAMPIARTGCDLIVPNRPAVSTSAAAACRCRYQSLTAGGMIYDHVSLNLVNWVIKGTGRAQTRDMFCDSEVPGVAAVMPCAGCRPWLVTPHLPCGLSLTPLAWV